MIKLTISVLVGVLLLSTSSVSISNEVKCDSSWSSKYYNQIARNKTTNARGNTKAMEMMCKKGHHRMCKELERNRKKAERNNELAEGRLRSCSAPAVASSEYTVCNHSWDRYDKKMEVFTMTSRGVLEDVSRNGNSDYLCKNGKPGYLTEVVNGYSKIILRKVEVTGFGTVILK